MAAALLTTGSATAREAFFNVPREHILGARPRSSALRRALGFCLFMLRRVRQNFRKRSRRTEALVSRVYDLSYAVPNDEWLRRNGGRRYVVRFRGNDLEVDGLFSRNVYAQMVGNLVRHLNARSVLEVGSGRGNNIAVLGALERAVRWTGLEPSAEGVRRSLAWQESGEVPEALRFRPHSADWRLPLPNVEFVEGSALAMPFSDNAFDAVFTILVLEQIPCRYPEALAEIRRVSRRWAIFIEPFREANDIAGRIYLNKEDYFRFSYKRFKEFGFRPLWFFTDYPQKLKFKSGLLVAEVVK